MTQLRHTAPSLRRGNAVTREAPPVRGSSSAAVTTVCVVWPVLQPGLLQDRGKLSQLFLCLCLGEKLSAGNAGRPRALRR